MDRAHAAVVLTDETVVHLVGRLTESTFAFVGNTTRALGEAGVRQTVILIQDPPNRALLAQFHPAVRLELPTPGAGAWRHFRAAVKTLCHEASERPLSAVHVHGMWPSLTAVYAAWFCGLSPKLFLMPHGTRLQGLLRAACALVRRPPAVSTTSAKPLLPPPQPIRLVEHPVDPRFFEWEREEARRPLIVAGSASMDTFGAAQFAQLAVLLGDAYSFNWVGRVDDESRARLKAANVGIFDEQDPLARAAKLAGAWLFVGYGGNPVDFPLRLAEAMALGLPCIAWDTPQTRNVLRHEDTGLLCTTAEQMLASLARLIDSPDKRRELGQRGKADAARRFHPATVRDLLHITPA